MKRCHSTKQHSLLYASVLLGLLLPKFSPPYCEAFQLGMMSTGLTDIANSALRQSPATTTFVTNKMCPFAQKAWCALEVAKAPYEMKEISLYGSNGKPDWFLELNPAGTVPVLECYGGAVVLPDSDLILDKIQEGAVEGGSNLKPSCESIAADVKQWRSDVSQILPVGKRAVQQGQVKELMTLLKSLDDNVKGPYLCGEKITVADCAAFPFLWRIDNEFGPLDKEGCPKLKSWLNKCCEMEGFSKTVQSSWWWWW